LFVSNSQVIGCEDRLRNDLLCVEWDVQPYTLTILMFSVLNFNVFVLKVCQSGVYSAECPVMSCYVNAGNFKRD